MKRLHLLASLLAFAFICFPCFCSFIWLARQFGRCGTPCGAWGVTNHVHYIAFPAKVAQKCSELGTLPLGTLISAQKHPSWPPPASTQYLFDDLSIGAYYIHAWLPSGHVKKIHQKYRSGTKGVFCAAALSATPQSDAHCVYFP